MKIAAPVLLAVVAFWALSGPGGPSEASHACSQVPDPNGCQGVDWLWPDLEAGGDQRLQWWICEGSPASEWTTGVEVKWDDPLRTWSFDGVANCEAQAVLFWEDPAFCADPLWVACTVLSGDFHADHVDIVSARIYFDINHPQGHGYSSWGTNFKTSIAAHEWGHVLGLADHPGVNCLSYTDMIQADTAKKAADNPCWTGPTPSDVSSVRCNVYGNCGDFSGDTCTDVLVRQGGDLKIVRGNCAGAFSDQTAVTIGTGWGGFKFLLRPGDFNGNSPNNAGEACTDVIAHDSGSPYWARLYRGNCGQGGQYFKDQCCGTQIGSGWGIFSWVFSPGDFSGDSCADVIFRHGDVLKMARGNCAGQFIDQSAFQISGPGWSAVTWILGPGDWNADGCSDIIARFTDGTLKLYGGNCGAGGQYFKDNGTNMGGGVNWSSYTWLASPGDFTGDGCMDVFSRDSVGTLRVHYGNCGTGFSGSGTIVGTGWNIFDYIY